MKPETKNTHFGIKKPRQNKEKSREKTFFRVKKLKKSSLEVPLSPQPEGFSTETLHRVVVLPFFCITHLYPELRIFLTKVVWETVLRHFSNWKITFCSFSLTAREINSKSLHNTFINITRRADISGFSSKTKIAKAVWETDKI